MRHSVLKTFVQIQEFSDQRELSDPELLRLWLGPYRNLSGSVKQNRKENTVKAIKGLSVGVCVGSGSVYLGDPPVPVWGQGITGATEAIIQQTTRWGWYTKQHFIVAVALGQLCYAVALSVRWTREAKGLTAGFGRQLVRENRTLKDLVIAFINLIHDILPFGDSWKITARSNHTDLKGCRWQATQPTTNFTVPCCCMENYSHSVRQEVKLQLLILKQDEFGCIVKRYSSYSSVVTTICWSIQLHMMLLPVTTGVFSISMKRQMLKVFPVLP